MCVMGGPPSLRVRGLFFCQRAVAGTLAPAKPDLGVEPGIPVDRSDGERYAPA